MQRANRLLNVAQGPSQNFVSKPTDLLELNLLMLKKFNKHYSAEECVREWFLQYVQTNLLQDYRLFSVGFIFETVPYQQYTKIYQDNINE